MNGRPITGAVLIILLAFGQPVLAVTEVPASIEGDTIWTKENGPYQITGQVNFSSAAPGSTLTIGPGTVVEFADQATINVFGDLVVNGTAEEPVLFGSTADSTLRNWKILMFGSTNSSVSHLLADSTEYALMVFDGQASLNDLLLTDSDLLFDDSTVSVHNSVLEGGSLLSFDTGLTAGNLNINDSAGISLISDAGSLIASGIYVSNGQSGVNISGGNTANISGLYVSNVDGPALNINQSTVSVSNSSFSTGKNIGLGISGDSVVDLSGVSVSSFMAPGIAVDGSSLGIHDLESVGNLIGIAASNSNMNIDRAVIKDNTLFGIDHSGGGSVKIGQSRFNNNGMAGVSGNGTETVDATGNYWGHPDGPTLDPMNPEAVRLGDGVMGNVAYEPWISEYCESECYSNIMFLPGIMSSRLYKDDKQLWEPGTFTRDEEFSPLYLDENGKSIDPEIYTKDVLDNGYAYGKLVEDLNELKTSGAINDYEAVPYDWRLSMEDVLNTGTKREDGTIIYGTATDEPYIENTLRRLAANSKSGKVTIIAHSNGGLVTKALINKLGEESKGLIDKIIFVGVPQLGTPQAIGSLLHGYNAGLPEIYPFVLSPERARDLALNMPMVYQLMPFSDYYNGEGASVSTPYVTFEDGPATQAFIDHYGYAITPDELEDFLNGAEGRDQVAYDDLNNAARANSALLADAQEMQASISSSWDVPEGIEMHQIAGIGEQTLAGLTYKTIKRCAERNLLFICQKYEDTLSYTPNLDVDGDGTVVIPSALTISDSEAKRWWIDLQDYNGATLEPFRTKHASILEINELRDFIINSLIRNSIETRPSYIYDSVPHLNGDRLSFILHSPLSLSAVDTQGNIVNAETSNIPGAEYQRYGEVQVLTIPIGTKFSIVLNGEAEGSFTLEMEEWEDEELVATSTLSAIPSSTSTIATISFTDGSLEDMGVLEIDYNGDTIVDLIYTPEVGETVFTPDLSNIDHTSSSGGRRVSRGQVLGSSIDISETLQRIEYILTALTKLKGHIPDEVYVEIDNQIRFMLGTILKNTNNLYGYN